MSAKIQLHRAVEVLSKNHVLYKGHDFLSYTQLCTHVSFTLFYKGHSIYVGPERASRYLRNSELKTSNQNPGGTP